MIDPNEAPEGYVAVAETDACNGCDFRAGTECLRVTLWDGSCITAGRGDGQDVIFIKREAQAHAAMTPKQVRDALFMSVMELHRLRSALAAAPQAEPVAWLFQHEETGLTQFVCPQQVEWGFEANNPRWKKIAPAYTHPAPTTDVVRDAGRYRFIRDADRSGCIGHEISLYAMESLDEYVDAAMQGDAAMKGAGHE